MSPGDVRTFNRSNGNAVVLAMGIWAERQGNQIHIHLSGAGGSHTTVTNDRASVRYHRTLFSQLRQVLLDNQCWPFGDEGAETQAAEV